MHIWTKGDEVKAERLNETGAGLAVCAKTDGSGNPTPNMTLRIKEGVAVIEATVVKIPASLTPTITAPITNPRIDLITIDSAGTIAITAGSENVSPTAPVYPTGKLTLAEIYLRPGSTAIYNTDQGAGTSYIYRDSRTISAVPASMPAGVMFPFAGSSAPAGFLLCDGSAISRSTYATLFAAIGTAYGAGDGSTTFNIPDTRASTIIGAGTKTFSHVITCSYTGVAPATDLITFAVPHKFKAGEQIAISSSGTKPRAFKSGIGISSGSVAVDGSGNIAVGSGLAAVIPVGSPVRCTAQSSTNFSAGTNYWVISNNGSSITVSTTKGGSIAGSGNSGSATFEELRIGLTYGTGSVSPYPDSGGSDYLKIENFDAGWYPEVNDELFGTNSISISGVSSGNTYYVVEVDLVNMKFGVSSSLGGSKIGVSGGGWISFSAKRRDKAFVVLQDDGTKIGLAESFANAVDGTKIDIVDEGSGTHTFTGTDDVLTTRALGEIGGEEKHRTDVREMPSHSHTPGGVGSSGSSSGSVGTSASGRTGGSSPHNNMPPFIVANFIIKT